MNEKDYEQKEKARLDAMYDALYANEPTSDVDYADEPIIANPMKPTQEQVIAWAREAWGEGKVYRFDSPKHWPEVEEMFVRLAALAYEAGRKDENEACAQIAAYLLKLPENDISAMIRRRIEQ